MQYFFYNKRNTINGFSKIRSITPVLGLKGGPYKGVISDLDGPRGLEIIQFTLTK